MTCANHSYESPVTEAIRDLRTFRFELQGSVAGLEHDWLIGRLLASRGVCGVDYPGAGLGYRMTVEYDADELNATALMDLLDRFGFRARRSR